MIALSHNERYACKSSDFIRVRITHKIQTFGFCAGFFRAWFFRDDTDLCKAQSRTTQIIMIENYLQKHYSPDTAKAYKREIEIYLSNYPTASTANYKGLTNYIGALRQRYNKPATISRILSKY